MSFNYPQPVSFALFLLSFTILSGCTSGERTYHLSGAITYDGKPVPAGHIIFEPDSNTGNNGGSGFAKIKDGRYDTHILDGRGVIGGPHIVRIHGLDGVVRGELLNGIPLFQEYTTTADLPKKAGTLDFAVPKR
jgi:hypothetical protein